MTSFAHWLGLYLSSLLVIVIGHLVIFLTVPALGTFFERPHTHGEREQNIMIKLSVFQIFNVACCSMLFLLEVSETYANKSPNGSFSPSWYVSGGQVTSGTEVTAVLCDVCNCNCELL